MRATPRCWTTGALAALAAFGLLAAPARAQAPKLWLGSAAPIAKLGGKGAPDFETNFFDPSKWPTTFAAVSSVLIPTQIVFLGDDDLQRRLYAFLRQNHKGLVMESLVLDGELNNCGRSIEGFMHNYIGAVKKLKQLGANLTEVTMDEPLFFGHEYKGKDSCQLSIPALAQQVADTLKQARQIYPELAWGDTEPAGTHEVAAWLAAYQQATGEKMAFYNLDVDWNRPTWRPEVTGLLQVLEQARVQIGLTCNGRAGSPTNGDWITAAERNCDTILTMGPIDHIIVTSWDRQPSFSYDETSPDTLVSLAAHLAREHSIKAIAH